MQFEEPKEGHGEGPRPRDRGRVVEMGRSRPEALRLERGVDGQLWMHTATRPERVWPVRCFPWSEKERYISLRNADDEELALVDEPARVRPASRAALQQSLDEVGFLLEIEAILALDEEVEIWTWRVQTSRGPRKFQTRRDEWPTRTPTGGHLIRDVAGDLFHIADVEALDKASRERFWVFLE